MSITGTESEIDHAIPTELNILKYSLITLSPVLTPYTKSKNNHIVINLDKI